MNEGLDEITGGGALKSQHQTFSALGHPFSWDLIFLRVLARRNTLANDLMFLWEVKLKDGGEDGRVSIDIGWRLSWTLGIAMAWMIKSI